MKLYNTVCKVFLVVVFLSVSLQAQSEGPALKMMRESLPRETVTVPGAMKVLTASQLAIKDARYVGAYHDVIHILGEKNSCSQFFGGPEAASLVFNQFAAGLTRTFNFSEVGIHMWGDFDVITNNEIGARYRLFNKAEINMNGPFYRRQIFSTNQNIGPVGDFAANTREARALMLLHELGHLIQGSSKQWLLPDDGHDGSQSIRNTRTIEGYCGESIRRLHAEPKRD
jgi:hypothetical protein